MKPKRSSKGRDAARRGGKKKVSVLNTEQVEYVDWKDVNLLRRFMSDRAKIRARRVSGNDSQQGHDGADHKPGRSAERRAVAGLATG